MPPIIDTPTRTHYYAGMAKIQKSIRMEPFTWAEIRAISKNSRRSETDVLRILIKMGLAVVAEHGLNP